MRDPVIYVESVTACVYFIFFTECVVNEFAAVVFILVHVPKLRRNQENTRKDNNVLYFESSALICHSGDTRDLHVRGP